MHSTCHANPLTCGTKSVSLPSHRVPGATLVSPRFRWLRGHGECMLGTCEKPVTDQYAGGTRAKCVGDGEAFVTDEPIYEYVKGSGWVVTRTDYVDVTFNVGFGNKKIRIFNRLPEPGEYYYSIGKGSWVCNNYKGFAGHCEWVSNDKVSPSSNWRFAYSKSHYIYAAELL